jgi:hypothetical protein
LLLIPSLFFMVVLTIKDEGLSIGDRLPFITSAALVFIGTIMFFWTKSYYSKAAGGLLILIMGTVIVMLKDIVRQVPADADLGNYGWEMNFILLGLILFILSAAGLIDWVVRGFSKKL